MASSFRLNSQHFPDPQRLGPAPGLSVASTLGMRSIAIGDFRYLAQATLNQQSIHAPEIGPGCGDGLGRKVPGPSQSFAKDGEGPSPGRAVMISRFSAR